MERDFKGVWIRKEIWCDTRLSALDKVILAEVDSLDLGESGCFASNQMLADFCQCSVTKVSTSISKLIQLGYLYIKVFDGRTRFLKSCLTNFERLPDGNQKADHQNLKDNNITNNINNKKVFEPPSVLDVQNYCKERKNNVDAEHFVDYYQRQNWKLSNGQRMSDWKAAVRTWEKNNFDKPKNNDDYAKHGELSPMMQKAAQALLQAEGTTR